MKRWAIQLIGVCGLLGVLILVTSFIINPGPGQDATLDELTRFKRDHYLSIMAGAWMQAVSPAMIVGFAIGVVVISGQASRLAGLLTVIAGSILLFVSLTEVTFYFSAVTGETATTGRTGMVLIASVQRLYAIIAAPFLFYTFSAVWLRCAELPRLQGWLGVVLGSCFFVLGIIQVFVPVQPIVDVVAMIQGLWWMVAASFVIARSERLSKIGRVGPADASDRTATVPK